MNILEQIVYAIMLIACIILGAIVIFNFFARIFRHKNER
jgi:heme/copper-type cytochrome/quinol oxidase subunit 2